MLGVGVVQLTVAEGLKELIEEEDIQDINVKGRLRIKCTACAG